MRSPNNLSVIFAKHTLKLFIIMHKLHKKAVKRNNPGPISIHCCLLGLLIFANNCVIVCGLNDMMLEIDDLLI